MQCTHGKKEILNFKGAAFLVVFNKRAAGNCLIKPVLYWPVKFVSSSHSIRSTSEETACRTSSH